MGEPTITAAATASLIVAAAQQGYVFTHNNDSEYVTDDTRIKIRSNVPRASKTDPPGNSHAFLDILGRSYDIDKAYYSKRSGVYAKGYR